MTRYTPLWQQAGSYPANYDRVLLNTIWPSPAASGAPATAVANTMNVSIPAGTAAVVLQSGQNTALCRWDTAEVVTSPAAPAAGNSRIDSVVCQVRDPLLDSGVNNDFIFVVVPGAAVASNPQPPVIPPNAMEICRYTVPGGAANLNGVTVTDRRVQMGGVGGGQTGQQLAYTERTTNAGPAQGGAVPISGLAVTFSLAAPRQIRLEAYVRHVLFGAVSDYGAIDIRTQAATVVVDALTGAAAASGGVYMGPALHPARTLALSPGSYTYTVYASPIVGQITLAATATSPMWIGAYDVGPA
jgi:hypothetical protein